jgi:hypothetical protein
MTPATLRSLAARAKAASGGDKTRDARVSVRGPKPRPPVERVMAKVEIIPGGCWIFTGKTTNGYGQVGIGSKSDGTKRMALAHRVVYEALVGPIQEGLTLDHVKARGCASRACVNPYHLEPVTNRVNQLRGDSPTAENARRTHCLHGHLLAGENLYRPPKRQNTRQCRECHRSGGARRYAAKKALAEAKRNLCPSCGGDPSSFCCEARR